MQKIDPFPSRLFGPTDAGTAESIVELLLDDAGFRQDLIDFADGELGPRDLLYRIQIMMENEEKRLLAPEDEAYCD